MIKIELVAIHIKDFVTSSTLILICNNIANAEALYIAIQRYEYLTYLKINNFTGKIKFELKIENAGLSYCKNLNAAKVDYTPYTKLIRGQINYITTGSYNQSINNHYCTLPNLPFLTSNLNLSFYN